MKETMIGMYNHMADNLLRRRTMLKLTAALLIAHPTLRTAAQDRSVPPNPPDLRTEIAEHLEAGRPELAVERAQQALRDNPHDPVARHEYVTLHMSLARLWLSQERHEDGLAALRAVLVVEPGHAAAQELLRGIQNARALAGRRVEQVDQLLRLELFESALESITAIAALRPDLAESLQEQRKAAWIGAADDHYLARNFREALALYENVLALDADASADLPVRWALSLALALASDDFSSPFGDETSRRLLDRAVDVLQNVDQPVLESTISGMLAERGGQSIAAGRAYSTALARPWVLPPVDSRRRVIGDLRRKVIDRLRKLYENTPTGRRGGLWAASLPGIWKQRSDAHFDVYARSDLVAGRVAETLAHHFASLSKWLELEPQPIWTPRCEVRVYENLAALHKATDTGGVTRAVSLTRVQGDRVLLRRISVFQTDQWLLSSTLPHELTHVMVSEKLRGALRDQSKNAGTGQPASRPGRSTPLLAFDEGIAVQVEPPARRLQYRRLLPTRVADPIKLAATTKTPPDQLAFYARCDVLAEFVLRRAGVAGLIEAAQSESGGDWWSRLGWRTEAAMRGDWKRWYASRLNPPRMPMMILESPAENSGR